jgi:ABC-2 type transport system ATP-binding protein
MASDAAIAHRDLSKSYGTTLAVDSVTFEVPRNTIFGLLGPNGAGKTTLFSLVAGFLKPTKGRVEVLGIDVERISDLRGRLSILPQDALFQANVPVLEQLVFFCQLSGFGRHEAEKEAFRALEIVGLADQAKRNARVLSHGMSKRLGIAQAFLGKPEVIMLDEPTAGLDPVNAKAIRDLIQQLQSSGTVVISSHNLREIQELCGHVAILDKGKLVECNAVSAITQAGAKFRMTFARPLADAEVAAIREVPEVSDVSADTEGEYTVHLELRDRAQDQVIADVVQRLVAKGIVPRSVTEGVSLESRFLEVTGGKG